MSSEKAPPSIENWTEEKYLQERVDDQINWYDQKSIEEQKRYKKYSYLILGASSLIPLVTIFTIENIWYRVIVCLLGIATSVSQGIINLNDYNENWIEYRTVCETLKKEKYMYLSKAGVYSSDESRFQYFVERVESIISQENVNWAGIKKDNKEGKSNGA